MPGRLTPSARSLGPTGCGLLLALPLALFGCGAAHPSTRAVPPVRLSLTAPEDQATTLATEVQVSGTVSPQRATVLVAGRPAAVQDGAFVARVPIRAGTNVIDVMAGAPRAAGAVTAVRVYRQLPVSVPALIGLSPAVAMTQLTRRGLRAKVVDVGGFLQALIPASKQVCRTVPATGGRLAPGSQVLVQVAKLC